MTFDSFLYSACGEREINEDFVAEKNLALGKLFIAADGLGGHLHGDIASKCVAEALMNMPEPGQNQDVSEWLYDGIINANNRLLDLIGQAKSSMKSTIAALSIIDEKAYIAHTGDTRIYFFHDAAVRYITEDHSVAYRKFKSGEITRGMIGSDEDQSALLKVLGNTERFEPDVGCIADKLVGGDTFLICTDGFWEYIYDEEILIDLLKSCTAREWAELMLLRVMERITGNNDNISLITVRMA